MFEGGTRADLQEDAERDLPQASNPWALRGMAERHLEATFRNVWESADPETPADVRSIYLANEHALEMRP